MKILYFTISLLLALGNTVFLLNFLEQRIIIPIILSLFSGIIFAVIVDRYFKDRSWEEIYRYEVLIRKGKKPSTYAGRRAVHIWIMLIWPGLTIFGKMPKKARSAGRMIYGYTLKVAFLTFCLTIIATYLLYRFGDRPEIILYPILLLVINLVGFHLGTNSYFLRIFFKRYWE